MQEFVISPASFKVHLDIINQIFEMEKKLERLSESNSLSRNINKIKSLFEEDFYSNGAGFNYHVPIGEPYNETRTDCEASIAGDSTERLVIVEVIKPLVRVNLNGLTNIVQKAVVIVQSADSI